MFLFVFVCHSSNTSPMIFKSAYQSLNMSLGNIASFIAQITMNVSILSSLFKISGLFNPSSSIKA